jgi:hopanoid biosynthesis associated RND transporter like protein HpnN
MQEIISRIVDFSRRNAPAVAGLAALLAVAGGAFVARRISVDSDTGKLVDPSLPWQRASADIARQFPQDNHLLLAVVDADTPEEASDVAASLAKRMAGRPDLFSYVRQPDANPYFRRYGMLFLPESEVQDLTDHLIAAQPFLGTLASDPSVRGVLDAVDLLAQGGLHAAVEPGKIDPAFETVGRAARAALEGRRAPLSWESMLSGRKATPEGRRHFVLASAALNFGQVEAASQALAGIREAAAAAGAGPGTGATVRVTGPVALDNDQLAVLSEGVASTTALALGLFLFWLALGLRSLRTIFAVLATLAVGLVGCLSFAVGVIGPFNPVSIAFVPLFVGIAIDFGIQFSVRFAAERSAGDGALARTALGVGPPLAVAAAATAVGFLAFAPTAYLGVRDLGIIAGVGMILALALNLTLLPALLTLLTPGARAEPPGSRLGSRLDTYLGERRRGVLAVALVLVGLAAVAMPRLRLDFNPVDLQNPRAESVRTLFDLMADPNTSPYTIELLAPRDEAEADGRKLEALPGVARVLSVASFVPAEQQPKLDLLSDAASLLGPTLSPAEVKPAPEPAQVLAALGGCADDLAQLGARGDRAAADLAATFRALVSKGPSAVPLLADNLAGGIGRRLDDLREILRAGPVTLETLPDDFRRDWVAPDGRWRLQVFPKGDMRDNEALRGFARAVRAVVPDAVGSAVEVDEWTRLAPRAFSEAGILAVVAISVLLLLVLRNIRDVALVLAPLLMAGALTLGAAALMGFSINFANIITLPMMLGIGVAFAIYFVMRGRSGEAGMLGSPTARGIVFSALTTGTAFGSLVFSRSPGMSEMGKFLSLALFFTLLCTLFVLPALVGLRASSRKGTLP